jgi:hypothetical protein
MSPPAVDRRQEVLRLAVRPEVVPHDVQLAAQLPTQIVEKPDEVFRPGVGAQSETYLAAMKSRIVLGRYLAATS